MWAKCDLFLLLQVYLTHEELHNDQLLQFGGLEFPQINYDQYNGRPYRYFYSCGFGHVFGDSLLKMDVHSKELKVPYQSDTTLRNPIVTWSGCYHIKDIRATVYHWEGGVG